jgi:glutamate-1-semialdehyde 2,1-aminomutase
LRQLCDDNDILLIFDEVMTGFRLARGGVQELLNVDADIICFGKVIGGGLPVGAFAARAK